VNEPSRPVAPVRGSERFALPALLVGAVGIGFAPILVRLSEVGPSATAAYRILIALPILWLLVVYERQRQPETVRPRGTADFKWLAVAGLFFTGDLAMWHWSLQITTVANSTLLTNFAPIFVTIGAWLILGERVSSRFVIGLILALGGAGLLVLQSVSLSTRQMWGDLLSVVTAIVYSAYLLSVKGLRQRFSTITIMAWSGIVSCGALFLVAWLSGEKMIPIDARGWKVLVALALVSHVGGQTLIAFALGHLPASFSSVSLLLQPVIAALLAVPLLREPLSGLQIIGGLITLAGVLLASRARPAAINEGRSAK
jgi:drug/metabolite transporter (DMT)-like permease